MANDIKTLELARVYESQGYTREALEIYTFLDKHSPSKEILAGLNRMKKKIAHQMEGQENNPGSQAEKKGVLDESLVIDDDLIDDAVLEQSKAAFTDSAPDPKEPNDICVLLEQWLNLVLLEDRMERVHILKAGS